MMGESKAMRTVERKTASRTRSAVEPAPRHSTPPHDAHPVVQRAASCACGGSCPRCQAGATSVPASVRGVLRSPGQPLAPRTRALFDARFGHDFSRVRVHVDAQAAESARQIDALAYAVGRDVVFGGGQYAPDTAVGQRLLAHELAHVVQQRGATGWHQDVADISQPGDAAERQADRAADAVLGGRPAPEMGRADDATIHRLVKTNGGEFETTTYQAINEDAKNDAGDVVKVVGAHITLRFRPNTLVEADHIGLTQTVKPLTSKVAGGPVTALNFVSQRNADLSLTAAEGDPGRAIDQGDPASKRHTIPNTSPLYSVDNAPGRIATTLTDVPPTNGQHASSKRQPDGRFVVQDAVMTDMPRRDITFAGQQFNHKFETTALVLDGPMEGTYLGSIEWGWQSDPAGNATLDPAAIRLISAGAPTRAFMAAASKWNDAGFTDPTTGITYPTVDLPVIADDPASKLDDPHSGGIPADKHSTRDLIAWIAIVDGQLARLAKGAGQANKQFEKKALEAALGARNILVTIKAITAASWRGRDKTFVKVTRGERSVKTPAQLLESGQTRKFSVTLGELLPLDGPLTFDVFERDPILRDRIVSMTWEPPFSAPLSSSTSQTGDYRVTVDFAP